MVGKEATLRGVGASSFGNGALLMSERPQPRPGTMARVAYNDKFARDALVSRVSDARSDITLAGDSRKSLQVRSVGSAGGVDGLEQFRKTTAKKRTNLDKLNQGRAAAHSEKKKPLQAVEPESQQQAADGDPTSVVRWLCYSAAVASQWYQSL